jgi:anti-anti-sigma regulatory factor
MRPLQISVEDKEDYVIVNLTGTSKALNKQSEEVTIIRETFRELAKQGKTKVLLDLQDVDYLASNTIGAFLSGNSIIKKLAESSSFIMPAIIL